MSTFAFDDPEYARRYAEGPAKFLPGYAMMHRLVIQLLAERCDDDAHLLVLGAGGGVELHAFAEARASWRFTGVDPSAEMLAQARRQLGPAAARVAWIEGTIADAPPGPFDAATCLLTLHLVPVAEKLSVLRALRERLRPGAPFAVVDHCLDTAGPHARRELDRFAQFALGSGADPEQVRTARAAVAAGSTCISPAHEQALLQGAGFTDIELFFAGLAWRGWICHA